MFQESGWRYLIDLCGLTELHRRSGTSVCDNWTLDLQPRHNDFKANMYDNLRLPKVCMFLWSEKVLSGIVEVCMEMHQSVSRASTRFVQELQRHNYVTPTAYLDLLALFRKSIYRRFLYQGQKPHNWNPTKNLSVHSLFPGILTIQDSNQ